MQENKDLLLISIQNSIKTYLENKSNMSLRSIALMDQSIGREYIRKLAVGKIPKEKIDKEKLLKILKLISGKNKFSEIANYFGNPISSFLITSFQFSTEEIIPTSEIEEILTDSDESCIVYLLVSNENGASIESIHNIAGEKGIRISNELVKNGIFTKFDNILKLAVPQVIHPSVKTNKKIISSLINQFKPEHFGKNRNFYVIKTGLLNSTGLQIEQEIFRKFYIELENHYNDERYKGNIPSFAVGFMDTFDYLKEELYEEELIESDFDFNINDLKINEILNKNNKEVINENN